MSTNNPQNQEMPTTVTGFCNDPLCNTPLTLPFPPILAVHHAIIDIISIPHTKGVHCPKCGLYHSIAIVNYSLQIGLVKDEKPKLNEDSLITPVTNILPFNNRIT